MATVLRWFTEKGATLEGKFAKYTVTVYVDMPDDLPRKDVELIDQMVQKCMRGCQKLVTDMLTREYPDVKPRVTLEAQ